MEKSAAELPASKGINRRSDRYPVVVPIKVKWSEPSGAPLAYACCNTRSIAWRSRPAFLRGPYSFGFGAATKTRLRGHRIPI
jgi:hypothetical protein